MTYRTEYVRQVAADGTMAKLCREYTDLRGDRRRLIYDCEGPAGSRWIAEDGSMITVDLYEMRRGYMAAGGRWIEKIETVDPWDAARDVVDSWVLEEA